VLAGPILDDVPEGWPFRMRARTADEARSAVGLLKARGVDFIKVHDRTPREAYFAIIEEARRLQLPVMGHVPRSITLDEAIDAGQYDIEHLAGLRLVSECSGGGSYRPGDCRALFDRLARRGVWQTPTLHSGSELMAVGTDQSLVDPKQIEYASPSLRAIWSGNQGVSGVEPETVAGLRSAAATAAAVVADMQRAGVGILAGCDGMVPGFCVHDELALMVRGGMSPLAALQTATLNAARSFGREDAMGTVTAGRVADLVLLEGDPLADIRNLARIHAVVVNGRLLDRQQLDAILADVKRRAQP
jgi:imidazolonepropionase-like amidohydrolase